MTGRSNSGSRRVAADTAAVVCMAAAAPAAVCGTPPHASLPASRPDMHCPTGAAGAPVARQRAEGVIKVLYREAQVRVRGHRPVRRAAPALQVHLRERPRCCCSSVCCGVSLIPMLAGDAAACCHGVIVGAAPARAWATRRLL